MEMCGGATILFTGDISIPANGFDPSDLDCCLTRDEKLVHFFRSADVRVAQWEMPLTNAKTPILKAGPALKGRPEYVKVAKQLGFDIALLANNHIGDYGPDATLETIAYLNNAGVKTVGAGIDGSAASSPLRFKAGRFSVSITNAAEHEFGIASADKVGAAALSVARIVSSIVELNGGRTLLCL